MGYSTIIILDKIDTSSEVVLSFLAFVSRNGGTWVEGASDTNPPPGREVLICTFPSIELFTVVKDALSYRKPEVIGVWNIDGTQQGYTKNINIA